MAAKRDKRQVAKESGFYEPYSYFSRTLRGWLVAYGIGAPALIVSQEHIAKTILSSGFGTTISLLFLAGACFQIAAALVYKYSMAIIYFSELDPKIQEWLSYKLADWVSESFALDLLFDLGSVFCFIAGTYWILRVVVGA